jgi:hypothetical protein
MGVFDFFGKKNPEPSTKVPEKGPELMKKQELEMVLIKVTIQQEEALLIKVYKNGGLVRNGAGGIPPVGIGCLTELPDSRLWDQTLALIPDALLTLNGVYKAENIRNPFSYTVAFYGESANGQTGEHADWKRSQGIHIEADLEGPHPPLLGALDGFASTVAGLTHEWFFDVVVLVCFGMKQENLLQGIISQPKTEAEKQQAWIQFMTQLKQGPAASEIPNYPKGKVYVNTSTGERFRMELQVDGWNVRYDFIPV